jgi:hypothetical protein
MSTHILALSQAQLQRSRDFLALRSRVASLHREMAEPASCEPGNHAGPFEPLPGSDGWLGVASWATCQACRSTVAVEAPANALPVPPCMRGSLDESLAYEIGAMARRAGLSRDCNAYEPGQPLYACWDEGWFGVEVES